MIKLTKSDLRFVLGGSLELSEEWYYICLGPAIGATSGVAWAFSIGGTEDLVNQDSRSIILKIALGLGTIGAMVGFIVGRGIN